MEPMTQVMYHTHLKPKLSQYTFHLTYGEVADLHIQKQLNEYHEHIPRPICNANVASYSIPIGIYSDLINCKKCKKCFGRYEIMVDE